MAAAKGKTPWLEILSVCLAILAAGSFLAARGDSPRPSTGMSLAYTGLIGVIVGVILRKTSVAIAAAVSGLVLFFVIVPVLQR